MTAAAMVIRVVMGQVLVINCWRCSLDLGVCGARVGVSSPQPGPASVNFLVQGDAVLWPGMLLLISPPPPQQQHGVQLLCRAGADSLIHYKHYTITYNYTSLLLFRKPINKIVSVNSIVWIWSYIFDLCTYSDLEYCMHCT